MKKRNKGSDPMPRSVKPGAASSLSRGLCLPNWLAQYRFLAVILSMAGMLGIYEATRSDLPKSIGDVPQEWLMDSQQNLAQTLLDVYPNRSQGHLLRAFQAGMCWEQDFRPEVCESFTHKDLRDVRQALEDAIALGGAADQEQLYHFYAVILLQSDEPPEVVEAAIARWKTNFPYSSRPDPRELFANSTGSP